MKIQEQQKLKFYFSLVVWGEDYVAAMLKIAIPSFLAPQNIPALSNLAEAKFIFVTTKRDYAIISKSAIFQALKRYISPVFIELGDEKYLDNRYARMTLGYEMATRMAIEQHAYMVYLVPDAIVSNGSLLKLEKYAYQGRHVVMVPGPRVVKEKLMHYVETLALDDDDALILSARELVELGMKMFHPQFLHYAIDSSHFTKWPHLVTWKAPDQGLLIRSFHLHPLMINCQFLSKEMVFNPLDTIDRNFIRDNFMDLNYFWIETDSDNILMYSMAEASEQLEYGFWSEWRQKIKAVVAMSQSTLVNELQKYYFYFAYKLHAKDLNQDWKELEQQTMSLVFSMMQPKKIYGKPPYLYRKFRQFFGLFFSERAKNKLRQWYWAQRKWITSGNSS